MWRRIAGAVLAIYLIIGLCVSCGMGIMAEEAAGQGGAMLSLAAMVVVVISATGLGLIVDMAGYLERVADNTDKLVNMQYGTSNQHSSGYTDSGETSMLTRALASDGVPAPNSTVSAPSSPKIVAPPSKWTCKRCFEENEADSHFCMNCGSKKSY